MFDEEKTKQEKEWATRQTNYHVGASFFGGTGAVIVGVPAAATVLPIASNGIGYGLGYIQGILAGGGVLLGKYYNELQNYVVDAKEMNLGYFNLYDKVWKVLDYLGDAWLANRGFLDAVAERQIPIHLNNVPIDAMGTYARELDYLFSIGINNARFVPEW